MEQIETPTDVINLESEVKTEVDPMNTPEVNQAAYTFQTSVPRIKSLASNMSRNALARVFKAVVEFPLADSYPTFRNKVENELFILTLSVMSAKTVMTSAFVAGREQQISDEATDGIVQELLEKHVPEEESNG